MQHSIVSFILLWLAKTSYVLRYVQLLKKTLSVVCVLYEFYNICLKQNRSMDTEVQIGACGDITPPTGATVGSKR